MNVPLPTISVVIPCYNSESYLKQTIESVMAQTHPPIEIIVVDDGSQDRSAAVAESFGEKVQLIRQANGGASKARNAGIRVARGDYLAFVDADDLLQPDAHERLATAVSRQAGAVAYMHCAQFVDDPTKPHHITNSPYETFFPGIIQTLYGPPIAWLTPREVTVRIGGFDERIRYTEDWDFWFRVGLTGAPLFRVDYPGALYRRHPDSLIATVVQARLEKARVDVFERMCQMMLERPELLEQYGDTLFWSSWAMLVRARQAGVAWPDLKVLGDLLRDVARRGPQSVRHSNYARLIRIFGTRWGETIRQRIQPDNQRLSQVAPHGASVS